MHLKKGKEKKRGKKKKGKKKKEEKHPAWATLVIYYYIICSKINSSRVALGRKYLR